MRIDYSAQTDLFDPDAWGWPVHIVGLGSIGSTLLLPLLQLGIGEVHLWDDDTVELRNIATQPVYRPSDVGLAKVTACAQFIRRQEIDVDVTVHPERIHAGTALQGVVLAGVDSMTSRSQVWGAIRGNPSVPLFMDGRIAGETVHLYAFDPLDSAACDDYATTLYSDEESSPLPCGARNIIHSPLQIAVWMISGLTLHARGEAPKFCQMAGLRRMQYS